MQIILRLIWCALQVLNRNKLLRLVDLVVVALILDLKVSGVDETKDMT